MRRLAVNAGSLAERPAAASVGASGTVRAAFGLTALGAFFAGALPAPRGDFAAGFRTPGAFFAAGLEDDLPFAGTGVLLAFLTKGDDTSRGWWVRRRRCAGRGQYRP
ncbi:MAG: hypothetical protein ACK59M_15215, partial [Pseudomonadota bacterium]